MDMDNQTAAEVSEPKVKSARKPKAKSADQAKGKRGLNLSLPHEVYERLSLHALADGKTISELVADLATTHLRRVHMVRTAGRSEA